MMRTTASALLGRARAAAVRVVNHSGHTPAARAALSSASPVAPRAAPPNLSRGAGNDPHNKHQDLPRTRSRGVASSALEVAIGQYEQDEAEFDLWEEARALGLTKAEDGSMQGLAEALLDRVRDLTAENAELLASSSADADAGSGPPGDGTVRNDAHGHIHRVTKQEEGAADTVQRLLGNTPVQDAEAISHIGFSFMASKALFAALDVGIFTKLHEAPKTLDELATELKGVAPRRLQTLMTALTSIGLVEVDPQDRRYSNNAATDAFLVRGAKYDFGDYLRFQIDKQMYPFMEHLTPVLKGERPATMAYTNYEEWMSDPEEARLYTESQHSGSTGPARSLARLCPDELAGAGSLLDVGGGSGGFSLTLARLFPDLKATVVDFPNVCEVGREYASQDEQTLGRVNFLDGNALEVEYPGEQGAVLASYISSSISGDDLVPLYSKAHAATKPGGTIFVHDFMVEDDRSGPPLAALWALQHMVFTPGAVSMTPTDVMGKLEAAGWEDCRVMEMIPGLTKVVVATKPEA